jgi:response regulator RpfG family c-di-GMP phosphodiesterase
MSPKSLPYRILHLDDSHLFTKGINQLLASRFEVNYFSYQSPIVALKDIQEHMLKKLPIDLIITDYNHAGITGYEFACEIRKLEEATQRKIPIMLLTMMNKDYPEIRKGIHDKIFDGYFRKDVDPVIFLRSIFNLLKA